MVGLPACSVLPHLHQLSQVQAQPVSVILSNQQQLTGRLVYVLTQGNGKAQISRLVMSELDGSHAQVLTQVNGSISSLSADKDGTMLIFTEQQNSFPAIFSYDIKSRQKTLLTPQRANHFSANISPDKQKILLSSSMNQNPEIFLANIDGSHLQQLTHNAAVDIAPFWSPNQQWFIFTSDRTALYHPQLYRYDFAIQAVSRITTTGSYSANAKISPTGDYISYISKLPNTQLQRVIKNLATGQTWSMADDGASEAMSFSPTGEYGVYANKSVIQLVSLPTALDSQVRPVYQLQLEHIRLPAKFLANASIREPIWLK